MFKKMSMVLHPNILPNICLQRLRILIIFGFNRIIDFDRLRNFMLRMLSFGEPYMNGMYFRLICANHLYSKMASRTLYLKTRQISFFNFPVIMPRFTKPAWELNSHRRRYNFINEGSCPFCNYRQVDPAPFFIHCPQWCTQRLVVMADVSTVGLRWPNG